MLSIIMILYRYAIALCDFFHLCVQSCILTFKALWYLVAPKPMKSITGEIVLITGTGHGIGRELGLQFARLGAKVVCLDINETNNTKTVQDISREGGLAWGYKCDVSKKEEVHTVCQKIRDEVGQVTILVNNAGIMMCKPFIKHSTDDIEKIFGVNVLSHFWMIREWLPLFISTQRGHVVAISSIAGLMATGNMVPYCSSKYAVKGLMDGLSEELRYAGRHPEIKFTCVHPFVVDTGLAQNPRIRFPCFNPVTTAADCAAKIIEGVRKEEEVICIPSKDFYGHKIMNLLPVEVRKAFIDFMDTGVDEDSN